MLSRVADSLYWMSRYLERAEHTVRLLNVNLSLMLDESASSADKRWQRVLAALSDPPGLVWNGDPYALVHVLALDSANRSSITSCIAAARANARHVREQISSEQWQWLNRLYLRVNRFRVEGDADTQSPAFLESVYEGIHLFNGVTDSTMSHGEGWNFIQMGCYLERASATVKLLEVYYREFWSRAEHALQGSEFLELIGLLRSCTAFEAYCKVYTAELSHDRIIEFLLLDPEFPHSVRYSIDCLQRAIELTPGEGRQRAAELSRLAGRLQASLSFGQIQEILAQDACAYLERIRLRCRDIHSTIFNLYINYGVEAALAV
jgi:uncharacterized alpha-E superfamily protein